MKKLLFSFVLAVACFSGATAQSAIINNPDNRPYFGIRVAGELTCPGDVSYEGIGIDIFKNGGGVEFGGIYNIPVVANFYVEPGLKFYYNTYSMDKKFLDFEYDDVRISGLSIRKFGMRVPVMAGYHFDFTRDIQVSVFTGPEFEIGFSAKQKVTALEDHHKFSESESLYGEDGGMKRFDLLWGFGAGVTYRNFYVGVNGSAGLCNMVDSSGGTFHENRVSLSLGYNF